MIQPRWYQAEACNKFWQFVISTPDASRNPLLVLPTGTGKSIIIALIIQRMLKTWPSNRCLMLTHVGELVKQNAQKMRSVWPEIDMGIHCASLGHKDLGHKATFGTIQSVASTLKYNKEAFDKVNLIIIDECHLLSEKESSQYRTVISALKKINPRMRVLGLTATPYRMQGGHLTEQEPPIFTDVVYDLSKYLRRLINEGYLSNFSTLKTDTEIDTKGLHIRAGDFKKDELDTLCGDNDLLNDVVEQSIDVAENQERKHWLCFIAGIKNTEKVAQKFTEKGISAIAVHSENDKEFNARAIADFRAGKVTCLVSADQLTTGFDVPFVDMLIMLRPTQSTALYVQILGRGMRPAEGKKDCLILDFAGNFKRHGPLSDIDVQSHEVAFDKEEKEGRKGPSDFKPCPSCKRWIDKQLTVCPHCGAILVKTNEYALTTDVDIIGGNTPRGLEPTMGGHVLLVNGMKTALQVSRNGNDLFKVTFLSKYKGKTHNVSAWLGFDFPIRTRGYEEAQMLWEEISDTPAPISVAEALNRTADIKQPKALEVVLRNFHMGRYYDEILRFIY